MDNSMYSKKGLKPLDQILNEFESNRIDLCIIQRFLKVIN